MIPHVDIYIKNPVNFYNEYELTEDELAWLFMMFEEGKGQDATDIFIQQFILPPGTKCQDVILSYMGDADSGIFEQKDTNSLIRNITLLILGLIVLLKKNYSKYIKSVYAPQILKKNELTNVDVKDSIINEVISKFEESVQGTLTETGIFVVNAIRTLQREFIVENFRLIKTKVPEEAMSVIIKQFKASLRTKYPAIYKAIEDRNVVTVSRMTEQGIKSMHYKMDYYIDMNVRATILNVDRYSVQIMALANDEKVVGYRLMDDRLVKRDREICQQILANKRFGLSILATDDDTAQKLGIMSIDEAKSTPDFAMGPNCRHGIYRLSQDFLNQINEFLRRVA